jgi:hypothetical protein
VALVDVGTLKKVNIDTDGVSSPALGLWFDAGQ